ncbi:MAG: NAD(P)H-hydrate dehydratase [Crocinitomicaceae bacterium]|nr:NAD(P)H-hydrate dehydratase [Crocinitomicaceae bacterium]
MKIYTESQIQAWDAFTIAHEPISSVDLMDRAATAFTRQLLATHVFESAIIFCGPGNNGGDGLVCARLLVEKKISVRIVIININNKFSDDFLIQRNRLPKTENLVQLEENNSTINITEDLVVDAIFGSGLNKSISGWLGEIIESINQSGKPICSIDIPSGLFCTDNRNNNLNFVINANQTITFQSPKMSFLYGTYAKYCGDLRLADIGLSEEFNEEPFAEFITRAEVCIKQRNKFSHKGNHGYLFIAAGFEYYAGAAVLASSAAMRTGCGYAAVHCSEQNRNILLSAVPESLFIASIADGIPKKASAVAVGPGLGTDEHALNTLSRLIKTNLPLVLDADAITLLASNRTLISQLHENTILTPHPLELERLIGKYSSPEETLEQQKKFSIEHRVYILQKGAYSKITTPDGKIYINSSGNAGMATAGMGDVLTGIIGSLLAQGYSAHDAVVFGTYIHGYAGDLVRRKQGETGMLASDVVKELPHAINSL